MLNADFTVDGSSAVQAHSVAYGATVALAALSLSFRTIAWEISSSSKSGSTAPAITLSGSPTGATASFVQVADPSDGLGRAWVVKCTQTDAQGNAAVSYRVVGTVNSRGRMPICADEANYRDATHGWSQEINELLNEFDGGGGGSSGVIPGAEIFGTVTAGKVTTMVSNDSSFQVVTGGTYTIASRSEEFEAPVGSAAINYVGENEEFYALITANITVKASVTGTTEVEAVIGFSPEEGDLTDWSQKATGQGGFIHLSVQFLAQMNTTSRHIICLMTRGTSYDSTLDVVRVQMSVVALGAVSP